MFFYQFFMPKITLKNTKFPAIVVSIFFIILLLHFTKLLTPVENFIVKVLAPVQSFVFRGGSTLNNSSQNIKSVAELIEENNDMDIRIRSLLVENQKLKNTIREQESLIAQVEFSQEREFKSIFSNVIGKDIFNELKIIIIDKGVKDGVIRDLPVVIEDGIFIGKIIEAELNFSKVLLSIDPRSQIAATFEGIANTNGVVSGDQGHTMKMDLIPKDIELKVQDIVVTSGLEPGIPKGLIIGEVSRIESEPNGFFQTAFINTLVFSENFSSVSVILPK